MRNVTTNNFEVAPGAVRQPLFILQDRLQSLSLYDEERKKVFRSLAHAPENADIGKISITTDSAQQALLEIANKYRRAEGRTELNAAGILDATDVGHIIDDLTVIAGRKSRYGHYLNVPVAKFPELLKEADYMPGTKALQPFVPPTKSIVLATWDGKTNCTARYYADVLVRLMDYDNGNVSWGEFTARVKCVAQAQHNRTLI